MVSKCPAFHYQPHSSLRVIIWYGIQPREIFHLILARGAWSCSLATFPEPVAVAEIGFRLFGSDTVGGQSDSLASLLLSMSVRPGEHKVNPAVIVSIDPACVRLVKGALCWRTLYARFHFYQANVFSDTFSISDVAYIQRASSASGVSDSKWLCFIMR